MMEAQEMFRVSNKVSRPEKALILGFMAGSRGRIFAVYALLPSVLSLLVCLVDTCCIFCLSKMGRSRVR